MIQNVFYIRMLKICVWMIKIEHKNTQTRLTFPLTDYFYSASASGKQWASFSTGCFTDSRALEL